MKLSRLMRQTIDGVADEGPSNHFYLSSLEPLHRRGLITKPRMVRVMVETFRWETELTDEGRRVKYQNTDD